MMTIGNGQPRPMRPYEFVNNGETFKDFRHVALQAPIGSRQMRLTIAGQVVNVDEQTRTTPVPGDPTTIFLHRSITVHTVNNAPLRGVMQSDVISAIREYDIQDAHARQQALAGQTNQGPARGAGPPPPPSAGAAAATAAGASSAALSETEETMKKIDFEYRKKMGQAPNNDLFIFIRLEKIEKDPSHKACLERMRTLPSEQDIERLKPDLPVFIAYYRLQEAWSEAKEQPTENARKAVLQQLLIYKINEFAESTSTVFQGAAFELINFYNRFSWSQS